jgi:hypothetical protein
MRILVTSGVLRMDLSLIVAEGGTRHRASAEMQQWHYNCTDTINERTVSSVRFYRS